ncbi:MAG: dipicolinate synthase subunit B, partial [Oscillospiraceae bacterium]|nr:dipicolinate synthase subunit B [Oscillospiraceae bacterium]
TPQTRQLFYLIGKWIYLIDAVDDYDKDKKKNCFNVFERAYHEPIGPKKMFDLLIVCPCTGNTLAKLAAGITDTPVTMAVKSHLRNGRPVLIAVSTNDALSASAKNIGTLLNTKNIYFVPFRQDDFIKKPRSAVADFSQIPAASEAALEGRQIQPILA